jgi:addiction module RelB/DinJ family antitoxin
MIEFFTKKLKIERSKMEMANTLITVDLDEQVKQNFEKACADVGMNLSAGINILIRMAIREKDLLFGMLTSEEATETKSLAQKQNEALKEFFDGIKKIDDEPIDDEFMAIINSGINIQSEVSL